jgi:hypothetical protein
VGEKRTIDSAGGNIRKDTKYVMAFAAGWLLADRNAREMLFAILKSQMQKKKRKKLRVIKKIPRGEPVESNKS